MPHGLGGTPCWSMSPAGARRGHWFALRAAEGRGTKNSVLQIGDSGLRVRRGGGRLRSAIHNPQSEIRNLTTMHPQAEASTNVSLVIAGEELYNWKPLQKCLAREAPFIVLRCAATPADVFFCCQRVMPCVLLVDQPFADAIDSLEFGARIHASRSIYPLVRVERNEPSSAETYLRMGYCGCVPADISPRALAQAARAAASGLYWADRAVLSRMLRGFLAADHPSRLTQREAEILSLIARGYRNKEIAEKLCLSFDTVRWHIRGIYAKIGVHDRLTAALYGMEQLPERAQRFLPPAPAA